MKGVLVAFLLVMGAVSGELGQRLCPEGFRYAGDDTPGVPVASRSRVSEEVYRTPTYSCYRWGYGNGLNDALHTCKGWSDSELVILEGLDEAERVFSIMRHLPKATSEQRALTSGMYFTDVDMWLWLGSGSEYNLPNINHIKYNISQSNENGTAGQCLLAVATTNPDEPSGFEVRWEATGCNKDVEFICEVRVVTVTYISWFYANWLSVVLVSIIILLVLSLCFSSLSYTNKKKNHAKVYRAQKLGEHSHALDNPPSYSDITQQTKQQGGGRRVYDKYVIKGREFLARVHPQGEK